MNNTPPLVFDGAGDGATGSDQSRSHRKCKSFPSTPSNVHSFKSGFMITTSRLKRLLVPCKQESPKIETRRFDRFSHDKSHFLTPGRYPLSSDAPIATSKLQITSTGHRSTTATHINTKLHQKNTIATGRQTMNSRQRKAIMVLCAEPATRVSMKISFILEMPINSKSKFVLNL